jgi:hypothetical protein
VAEPLEPLEPLDPQAASTAMSGLKARRTRRGRRVCIRIPSVEVMESSIIIPVGTTIPIKLINFIP